MSAQSPGEPRVVAHAIPIIEVYQVTDDELTRIEGAATTVENASAFMFAGIAATISIGAALAQGTFPVSAEIWMKAALGVSIVVSVWAGFRWYYHESALSKVLSQIRSRRTEPGTE